MEQAELQEALLGLGCALTRYREKKDGTAVRFIALTECLMWIRALDENMSELLPNPPDFLVGLRLARNRSIHQLAVVTTSRAGTALPHTLPATFGNDIVWRPLEELPPGKSRLSQQRAYTRALANRPVEASIQDALALFAATLKL